MKRVWTKKMHFAFDELKKKDILFEKIIEMYGLPKDRSIPNNFASLARIIIGQQISRSAAESIYSKLNSENLLCVKNILRMDLLELKSRGLSLQKCKYLHNLANKIANKEIKLNKFENLSSSEVFKSLIILNGIGEWTIKNYMLFALQDVDAWPGSDLALQESIKKLNNLKIRPNNEYMNKISNKWKPFRGAAALILWHYHGVLKSISRDK